MYLHEAVRQADRLFESLYLAFVYDLQVSQLPLNLFFDRQALINLYNILLSCQSQNYPPIVIANQMRLPSKSISWEPVFVSRIREISFVVNNTYTDPRWRK
jgi:hypothetical protein